MQKLFACALLCAALTGCAGMNSDFDCNKTATDQCLSMSDASKLASKHKSLDDLSAEKEAGPKPAAEALATPGNAKSAINPYRSVSVASLSPRPISGQIANSGDIRASTLPVHSASLSGTSVAADPKSKSFRPLAYGFMTQDDLAKRFLNVATGFKPNF
ncbi:hypothetical protein RM151_22730 (plasmid) [Pantoea agglomerans]|uniref:hypothetical protein n=1 Tax=Enterobacter agglomerans TaxID=549 RepID=UPI00289832EA|nr:hypothetical protein [Pantoea agglomerans]WNK60668.1 hypothetical protein RM151_22730 [Pantoea agglomerans]